MVTSPHAPREPRRPPRVDRAYARARAMQADMDRYYEQCRQSPKGSGPDGKEYCARTAWMILRKAGHYRDYPAFRRRAKHTPYAAPAGECGCSGGARSNPLASASAWDIGVGVAGGFLAATAILWVLNKVTTPSAS